MSRTVPTIAIFELLLLTGVSASMRGQAAQIAEVQVAPPAVSLNVGQRTGVFATAYDAKNRYNLPETLALSWDDFFAAVEVGRSAEPAMRRARADEHRARVETVREEIGDAAYAGRARSAVASAGDDVGRLAEIENRVTARWGSTVKQNETTETEKKGA